MSRIVEAIDRYKDDAEIREFLRESSLLTDRLSVELIKKIGGPNSPLSVTDLPIQHFAKDITLARLYELEKLKIITSKFVKKGKRFYRLFEATPKAKKLAEIFAVKE